jgi:hypothetical protein
MYPSYQRVNKYIYLLNFYNHNAVLINTRLGKRKNLSQEEFVNQKISRREFATLAGSEVVAIALGSRFKYKFCHSFN